jgi:uncharacterized protein with HEPN domain
MTAPNLKNDLTRVRHMLDFANKAVLFTKGRQRSDMDSNEMLAMATIHLIEMIGESSKTISLEFKSKYSHIPWDLISGTRNRLAHGYIDVDLDIIWTIVTKDLPPLIVQLRKILKQECV